MPNSRTTSFDKDSSSWNEEDGTTEQANAAVAVADSKTASSRPQTTRRSTRHRTKQRATAKHDGEATTAKTATSEQPAPPRGRRAVGSRRSRRLQQQQQQTSSVDGEEEDKDTLATAPAPAPAVEVKKKTARKQQQKEQQPSPPKSIAKHTTDTTAVTTQSQEKQPSSSSSSSSPLQFTKKQTVTTTTTTPMKERSNKNSTTTTTTGSDCDANEKEEDKQQLQQEDIVIKDDLDKEQQQPLQDENDHNVLQQQPETGREHHTAPLETTDAAAADAPRGTDATDSGQHAVVTSRTTEAWSKPMAEAEAANAEYAAPEDTHNDKNAMEQAATIGPARRGRMPAASAINGRDDENANDDVPATVPDASSTSQEQDDDYDQTMTKQISGATKGANEDGNDDHGSTMAQEAASRDEANANGCESGIDDANDITTTTKTTLAPLKEAAGVQDKDQVYDSSPTLLTRNVVAATAPSVGQNNDRVAAPTITTAGADASAAASTTIATAQPPTSALFEALVDAAASSLPLSAAASSPLLRNDLSVRRSNAPDEQQQEEETHNAMAASTPSMAKGGSAPMDKNANHPKQQHDKNDFALVAARAAVQEPTSTSKVNSSISDPQDVTNDNVVIRHAPDDSDVKVDKDADGGAAASSTSNDGSEERPLLDNELKDDDNVVVEKSSLVDANVLTRDPSSKSTRLEHDLSTGICSPSSSKGNVEANDAIVVEQNDRNEDEDPGRQAKSVGGNKNKDTVDDDTATTNVVHGAVVAASTSTAVVAAADIESRRPQDKSDSIMLRESVDSKTVDTDVTEPVKEQSSGGDAKVPSPEATQGPSQVVVISESVIPRGPLSEEVREKAGPSEQDTVVVDKDAQPTKPSAANFQRGDAVVATGDNAGGGTKDETGEQKTEDHNRGATGGNPSIPDESQAVTSKVDNAAENDALDVLMTLKGSPPTHSSLQVDELEVRNPSEIRVTPATACGAEPASASEKGSMEVDNVANADVVALESPQQPGERATTNVADVESTKSHAQPRQEETKQEGTVNTSIEIRKIDDEVAFVEDKTPPESVVVAVTGPAADATKTSLSATAQQALCEKPAEANIADGVALNAPVSKSASSSTNPLDVMDRKGEESNTSSKIPLAAGHTAFSPEREKAGSNDKPSDASAVGREVSAGETIDGVLAGPIVPVLPPDHAKAFEVDASSLERSTKTADEREGEELPEGRSAVDVAAQPGDEGSPSMPVAGSTAVSNAVPEKSVDAPPEVTVAGTRSHGASDKLSDPTPVEEKKISVQFSSSGEEKSRVLPMIMDSVVEGEGKGCGDVQARVVPPNVMDSVSEAGDSRSGNKSDSSAEQLQKSPTGTAVTTAGNNRDSQGIRKEMAPSKIPLAIPVTLKPPSRDDAAALHDAFPEMTKRKNTSTSKGPKKRRRAHLCIRISSVPSCTQSAGPHNPDPLVGLIDPDVSVHFRSHTLAPDASLYSKGHVSEFDSEDISSCLDSELEDSLAFFSDTHEEQDPGFIDFREKQEKRILRAELANIKKEYEEGVSKINHMIASQLQEKQVSAERNLDKLKSTQAAQEQKELNRLHQTWTEKTKVVESKINAGMKVLTSRQSHEMQKASAQHRQQAQQRGVLEQAASSEWGPIAQRLQAKQQLVQKEFKAKGEAMKTAVDTEYQREKEKLKKHFEKQKRNMEHGMQSFLSKMKTQFQQQLQRYLRAYASRLRKKREEIRSLLGESHQERSPRSSVGKDDKNTTREIELCAPSPVKLRVGLRDEGRGESPGAASRSKDRKNMLSAVRKQLSVEIHNEGLWVSTIAEKADDSKKDGDKNTTTDSKNKANDADSSEFIPWGIVARRVLHSIVCGEIPWGYGTDRFDFGDAVALQGGHIRCVVVDLRTSEETASAQRAAAAKEQEAATIKALERNVDRLNQAVRDAENQQKVTEKEINAVRDKAIKEVEKAKQTVQQLRSKYKHVMTPDGVPLPSLSVADQQKLTSAMSKYNTILETAKENLKMVEAAHSEKNGPAQKAATAVRQAQRHASSAGTALRKRLAQMSDAKGNRSKARLSEAMEAERAATRVSDVISTLHKTAESRREQLNQKRSSAVSSAYVQSLPGLPSALKKSLWHKMHRRRQQIVLRPTMEFVANDMKNVVEETLFYTRERSSSSRSHLQKEDAALRAEQLFLLSAFPQKHPESLQSTTPPSDSHTPWAEPGWQVNLDVPVEETPGSRSLLPRVPVSSLMQNNHSEYCSAPGRQVASIIKSTHLQALNTPLSAAAQAISLAETSPVVNKSELSSGDPFQTSEAAMVTGYAFAPRSPSKSSASQSRKKVAASKVDTTVAAATAATATPPAPAPSPPSKPKKPTVPKATAAPVLPAATPSPAKQSPASTKRPSSSTGARSRSNAKADKPAKAKRSRSKSSSNSSPRAKSRKSVEAAAAASVADAASQARNYIQQQAAAAASAIYGQQQRMAQHSMEQAQAAQFSPSFMKQVPPGQPNLQGLQQQQLQQTMAVQQQQLLPQPSYGSPQQQFQQQRLAQMRMMQQQQGQAGFPQQAGPNTMQAFFNPAAMQAAVVRQQSFGGPSQQPPPMPLAGALGGGRATSAPMAASPGQQRRTIGGDDINRSGSSDPLFMLPDVPPP